MIGILCALPQEMEAMVNNMTERKVTRISSYEYNSGILCGKEVVICHCGVGKVNAALCTEAMIISFPIDLVINSGVAGALRAPLEIGDVVVATDLVQHDVDTTAVGDPIGFVSTVNRLDFPCAPAAVEDFYNAAKTIEGINVYKLRIASGDQFITNADVKKRIVDTFDAYACEMEGCPIAQVCYVNGKDCVVIRAISDSSSGKHEMEYSEFMPMAAKNSAEVVMKYLSSK